MTWKTRLAVLAAILGGFTVVGAAASFAAPPLSSATADALTANGTALGVPGTLTVSESNAAGDGEGGGEANWSAATVAGTSVIGRSSAEGSENGEWTGAAAPAGAVVDAVNESGICPTEETELPNGGYEYLCVQVLPSRAPDPRFFGPYAVGDIAAVVLFSQDPQGARRNALIEVLPSEAAPGRGGCQTSEAFGGILTGFITAPELNRVLDIGLTETEYDPCPPQ